MCSRVEQAITTIGIMVDALRMENDTIVVPSRLLAEIYHLEPYFGSPDRGAPSLS